MPIENSADDQGFVNLVFHDNIGRMHPIRTSTRLDPLPNIAEFRRANCSSSGFEFCGIKPYLLAQLSYSLSKPKQRHFALRRI